MPVAPLPVNETALISFGFLTFEMSTMSIVFFAPLVMNKRFDAVSTAEISAPPRPAPVTYRPTNFNSEPFGVRVSAPAEEV